MTLLRSLIITTVMAMVTPAMSLTVGDKLSPRFHRATAPSTSGQWWSYSAIYDSSSCDDDAPAAFFASPYCSHLSESSECSPLNYVGTFYDPYNISEDPLMYEVESCTADVDELADSLYGDQAYIRTDYYSDLDCQTLDRIDIFLADGNCHASYTVTSTYEVLIVSWRLFVNDNGSATYQQYDGEDCSGYLYLEIFYEQEQLASNECVSGYKYSINAKAEDGLGAGTIAGIVAGCVAVVGLVAIGYVAWRRRRQTTQYQQNPSTTEAANATADDSSHPYRAED